jgi:GT2 family glycosyltransferase
MIERAIASIWNQRPAPPAELIVVDDGSDDDTATLAEAAGARVIRHETNRGSAAARNTGARAATYPWIAPLDSDDEWLPNHLATLYPLRHGHVFVAGASLAVNRGGSGGLYSGPLTIEDVLIRSPAQITLDNFVPASGILYSAALLHELGGYSEQFRNAEDFDLWLRMLERGTGLCVPEPVVLYHFHAGQKSQKGRPIRARVRGIIDTFENRPWCTPQVRDRRRALDAWDDFREALSNRKPEEAARDLGYLLAKPARVGAVAEGLRRRRLGRRLAAERTEAADG